MDDDLEFTIRDDESGDGRARLLQQASIELDEQGGHLGGGATLTTREAQIAAHFNEDRAELAMPEVLALDLAHLDTDEHVNLGDVLKKWRFLWVKFPVDLWTRKGWGFNRLEFKAEFNPEDDEAARPRVHDALPTQEFATLARAHVKVEVGLGADLKFAGKAPIPAADLAGLPLDVKAALEALVSMETRFAFTPPDYEVRVPIVRRSNLDLDSIRWRLEGARWVQEQDPGLRIVLKVPRDQHALRITAALRARRNWNSFDADLRGRFESLGERWSAFFRRGAPIGDVRTWDLSHEIAED